MKIEAPNGAGYATAIPAGQKPQQQPETFFQQYTAVRHPFNPQEIVLTPLPGTGIPMRDYFAARAMQSFLLPENGLDHYHDNFTAIAADAYSMADAMMEARKHQNPGSQFHEDYMSNGK